jgi:hypothetical protein
LTSFSRCSGSLWSSVGLPNWSHWQKALNDSIRLVSTAMESRRSGSDRYRISTMVRMTRPSSRKARYSLFLRESWRSRRSSATLDSLPARMDSTTRIRSGQWVSISRQLITFLPGSPNRASMCEYSVSRAGRYSS